MYDLAIIGAGAAGLEAARCALASKLKVALIEKGREHFGGVCLNKGCIPTKFYLTQSENYKKTTQELFNSKNLLLHSLRNNALKHFQKQGADIVWGEARFVNEDTLAVGSLSVRARYIIIATGSLPCSIFLPDNKKIFFAEDIFSFPSLPQKILIVGAGCIGLEMACFFRNVSREVLVIEKEDYILPAFDRRVVQRLENFLGRKGIRIKTSTGASENDFKGFDMILLSTGRTPAIGELALSSAGVAVSKNGMINVDQRMRTSVKTIYACGDVASTKMYAYAAQYQARLCIENIMGNECCCDYTGMPECVYTIPQLACVGIGEEEARKRNIPIQVKGASFVRFASSHVYGDTGGYVKVVADERDIILGATVLSHSASELISIFSLAVREGLSLSSIKECIFLHPTLSEIIPAFLRD